MYNTAKQSSQRHKEPGLKAWFELFLTNVSVLEMRWQHVSNLGCNDMEAVWIITRSLSTWHGHVLADGRSKPGPEDHCSSISVL